MSACLQWKLLIHQASPWIYRDEISKSVLAILCLPISMSNLPQCWCWPWKLLLAFMIWTGAKWRSRGVLPIWPRLGLKLQWPNAKWRTVQLVQPYGEPKSANPKFSGIVQQKTQAKTGSLKSPIQPWTVIRHLTCDTLEYRPSWVCNSFDPDQILASSPYVMISDRYSTKNTTPVTCKLKVYLDVGFSRTSSWVSLPLLLSAFAHAPTTPEQRMRKHSIGGLFANGSVFLSWLPW